MSILVVSCILGGLIAYISIASFILGFCEHVESMSDWDGGWIFAAIAFWPIFWPLYWSKNLFIWLGGLLFALPYYIGKRISSKRSLKQR